MVPTHTPGVPAEELTQACYETVNQLTAAFMVQDIDKIIRLFAEDSTYCDIRGPGQRGRNSHGKTAIRSAFTRQFELMGPHTFEQATIVAQGQRAFSSWTLVLGDSDDPAAPRFEGADHFELDKNAKITLKKAWLKGHARLARTLLLRNPIGALKLPTYAFFG